MAKKIRAGRLREVVDNLKQLSEAKIQLRIWKDKKVQQAILHLNRTDQIFKDGISADGNPLGVYSNVTEFLNQGESFTFNGVTKIKKAGEPYILFDKGDFFATFDVTQFNDGVKITADSNFEGNELLTDSYVTDLLGLTNKSTNELAIAIIPFAIRFVREQILK